MAQETQRMRRGLGKEGFVKDGLLKDDRGVMVVVGALLSFFMIGTVWYVLGIGNVIAYREQLQNASDASAFAGAVYNARGMNLLSMINVIMGFALTLVVVAKILQIIFWGVWAGHCAACASSWVFDFEDCFQCGSYGPIPGSDEYHGLAFLSGIGGGDIPGYVKSVEEGVRDALEILHYTEEGVAVAWPWLSASKSNIAGTYYENGVAITTTFSYSQISFGVDALGNAADIKGAISSVQSGSVSPLLGALQQNRLGLPVAFAKYTDLCKMAVLDVTTLDNVIPSGFLGILSSILAEELFLMDGFFCDVTNGGDLLTGGFGGLVGGLPTDGVRTSGLESILNFVFGFNPDGTVDKGVGTYSDLGLYSKAKMGDNYFSVWSTGLGVWTNALDVAKPGLRVSAMESKTNTVIGDPPDDATLGVARSEFYYEPKNNESASAGVKGLAGTGLGLITRFIGIQDLGIGATAKQDETNVYLLDYPTHNCLYNMRWRARLMRYHGFPSVGASEFQSLFSAGFEAATKYAEQNADSFAGSGLAGQAEKTAINGAIGAVSKDVQKEVNNVLKTAGAPKNSVTDTIPPAPGIYH